MNGKSLVGKTVDIKGGHYAGHWGVIVGFDGERFSVSRGSIGDMCPVFDRDEFTVRRKKNGPNRSELVIRLTTAQATLIADSQWAVENHGVLSMAGNALDLSSELAESLADYAESRAEACTCNGMGLDGAREARSWKAIRLKVIGKA